ncbi:MAG: hypothetical protein ACC707_14765, partial [Thiohalomonadales bacterium]
FSTSNKKLEATTILTQGVYRTCQLTTDKYQLREPEKVYQTHFTPEKTQLRPENSCFWKDNVSNTST